MVKTDYSKTDELLSFKFLEKKLDWNISPSLLETVKSELDKIVGQDKKSDTLKVVFDMAESEYISSAFIRIICMTLNRLNSKNFTIINTNSCIKKILQECGLIFYLSE
ncbi:MAG TPA: hypothetical protein DD381_08560 [Lentisphaeria bacterium]|nr:MAG: hypothetical protein A2X47_11125 [Lentisphaerae bacterium GWF2_38_69]HBM16374.1 hypothetical protein [Lentisphaeria bacterium]